MSLIEVPQIGSWWENPKQPGQVIEVVNLVHRKRDTLVIYQWGLAAADVTAYPLERFFETFTERGQ